MGWAGNRWSVHDLALVGAGTVRVTGFVPDPLRARAGPARIAVDFESLRASELAALADLQLFLPGRQPLPPASGRVELTANPHGARLRAELDVQGLPRLRAQARIAATGTSIEAMRHAPLSGEVVLGSGPVDVPAMALRASEAGIRARVGGTVAQPIASVEARFRGLASAKGPIGDLELNGGARPGALSGRLAVHPTTGGSLRAHFEAAGRGGAAWAVSVEARDTPLDFLALFPSVLDVEQGRLTADLVARKKPGRAIPALRGSAILESKRLAVSPFGELRALRVRLEASRETLRIAEATARGGAGQADLSGAIRWAGAGQTAEIDAELRAFPFPTPARPELRLSTRAQATLRHAQGRVEGEVRLARGEAVIDPRRRQELHPVALPAGIEIHRAAETGAASPARKESLLDGLVASVRIRVARGFFLRSPEANVDLQMDATAHWEGGELALVGRVEVLRGEVSVAGRPFQVDRFVVLFAGAPLDPALDGVLRFRQREIEIVAEIQGTLQKPAVNLSSDPPMSSAQMAMVLATGAPEDTGAPAGAAELAASGAASLLAGRLAGAVGEALPVDVFNVELGPGGRARRVEAGTCLSPNLFVAFGRNLFAGPGDNANEVVADYQLRPSLSLRTRFGDRQVGGVSLLWERRIRSRAQREASGG